MSIPKPDILKILVIDDHELVLDGTINALQKQYPSAEIFMAQTAQMARILVEKYHPTLIVMDLSIPESADLTAQVDTGIKLLKTLLQEKPTINLVVQSTYTRSLVRIRHEIDVHKGGFTVADKSLCTQEMLNRIEWAVQGLTHTKDIKAQGLEVKPEWLIVLDLAFGQGLQDKAIAQTMNISERMVRHYWTKIQDVLGVYPESGKNIRIQTEKRARELGLID